VITADAQFRAGKTLPLKKAVDDGIAMGGCEHVQQVVVLKKT